LPPKFQPAKGCIRVTGDEPIADRGRFHSRFGSTFGNLPAISAGTEPLTTLRAAWPCTDVSLRSRRPTSRSVASRSRLIAVATEGRDATKREHC